MTDFTAHFRFPIPDFEQEPWHDELESSLRSIDAAIYNAILGNTPLWANNTAYQIGDIVIDATDGLFYTCAVAHTSPAAPTTFASFRAANPTYWNTTVTVPQFRGNWTPNTTYTKGDFVIDAQRYAVANVSHVSTTTFNADLATGKWVVLVDLTIVDQGINNDPEGSIAAAPTTNIGGVGPTRIVVSGSATITSFGTVGDQYKILRYQSTPTIVNSATIILIGGANRVIRPGDIQILTSNSAGVWRELAFHRADGNPATTTERGVIALATAAEVAAGTDATKAVTPSTLASSGFPSGTRMIFQQTNAPVGWTKSVTHNDKALRIVSGAASSGGNQAFSTVFGKSSTDGHTLSVSEIPDHVHLAYIHDIGHTHPFGHNSGIGYQGGVNAAPYTNLTTDANTQSAATNIRVNSAPPPAHTGGSDDATSGVYAPGGLGGSHTHPMDIRVQYVDVIIAQKD